MSKKIFPLRIKSDFSLQLGLSTISKISAKINKCEYDGWALSDDNSLAGAIQAKKKTSSDKKVILGCDFPISEVDKVCIYAKNHAGWLSLVRAFSERRKERIIPLERLASYSNGNFICLTGFDESEIYNAVLKDGYDESKALNSLKTYEELFGKENFFIGIPSLQGYAQTKEVVGKLREMCEKHNFKGTAILDSYYINKEDAPTHRILLCAKMRTPLTLLKNKIAAREPNLLKFLSCNDYYLASPEECGHAFSEAEIDRSHELAALCENYGVVDKPSIPPFDVPKEFPNSYEYLVHLCRHGWKRKIQGKISKEDEVKYAERIKKELAVIKKANLEDYFLVTHDFCNWVDSHGWLRGYGRGSAAGCLTSFLLNITDIDPILHGLIFERFYSEGRNMPPHVSFEELPFSKFK